MSTENYIDLTKNKIEQNQQKVELHTLHVQEIKFTQRRKIKKEKENNVRKRKNKSKINAANIQTNIFKLSTLAIMKYYSRSRRSKLFDYQGTLMQNKK